MDTAGEVWGTTSTADWWVFVFLKTFFWLGHLKLKSNSLIFLQIIFSSASARPIHHSNLSLLKISVLYSISLFYLVLILLHRNENHTILS